MNRLIHADRSQSTQALRAVTSLDIQLTVKELETLEWVIMGKTAWEISRIQGCTEAGVNFHFCNIRRKFGVTTLRAALVKAIELGVVGVH